MKSAWLPSEKWFLVLSSLVTLGFGALGVGLSRDTRPDVKIMPHAPLPVPNGLDIYGSALLHSSATPPVDPVLDAKFNTRPPAQKRACYSLAQRNAWEKGAAPAWTLFEQAKAAQSLMPREKSMAYWQLPRLELYKVVRANTFALRGDWNGALQNDLDVTELSHDLMRGSDMLGFSNASLHDGLDIQNVQFAGTRIGARGEVIYEDIVLHLNARESKAGAARLESLIETMPKLSDMAREQKAVDETLWLQTWNQPAPGQSGFDLLLHPKTAAFEGYLREMDKFIAAADRPCGAQPLYSFLQLPPNGGYIGQLDVHWCALSYAFSRAREQELMLRLALRAYRLEHGAPPAKLSDLVPTYLRQIPLDPFGKGEKWHYKNGAAWSIGPNEKDDGGKPLPMRAPSNYYRHTQPEISQATSGDIVARG